MAWLGFARVRSGASRPLRVALGLSALLVLPACQWLAGPDDFSGGEDPSLHRCNVLPETKLDARGLAMMRVDVPGKSCLWIDRDEVTVGEYDDWLFETTLHPVAWDATYCAWKTRPSDPSHQSLDTTDECAALVLREQYQPFHENKPIRCVDWCDAEAFCRAANKHLCYDYEMISQVPRDITEWSYACSNSLTTVYPWGMEEEGSMCNVDQRADSTLHAQRGPYPVDFTDGCSSENGVRNLIGNVAEWVYGCNYKPVAEIGKVTPCLTRGGAYYDSVGSCMRDGTLPNDTRDPGVGFRCCDNLTEEESIATTTQMPR